MSPVLPLVMALSLSAADAPARLTPLTFSWKVDGAVTGVLLAGWLGSEAAFKKQLAPTACHWCSVNAFDDGVRGLFNPTRTPSSFGIAGPDLASNLVGFGALPLGVLGVGLMHALSTDAAGQAFLEDTVMICEATFAGLVLDQGVKFAAGRARPYTIGASPALLAQGRDPADHYLSFFSGHSTWAFGVATAAGTVASLRGYKLAWLTWAVGLPLAATTVVLRLAADKHWASDVLVGSAVGALFGAAVPLLFHGPESEGRAVQVLALPGGVAVAGRF